MTLTSIKAVIPLTELVARGRFDYHNPRFQEDDSWAGECDVEVEFHVLDMGGYHREADLTAALERESARLHRTLSLATAYGAAAFAALGIKNGKTPYDASDQDGWNGRDSVVAWGSKSDGQDGCHYVTCLRHVAPLLDNPGGRSLSLLCADYAWHPRFLVLCVVEKVPESQR